VAAWALNALQEVAWRVAWLMFVTMTLPFALPVDSVVVDLPNSSRKMSG